MSLTGEDLAYANKYNRWAESNIWRSSLPSEFLEVYCNNSSPGEDEFSLGTYRFQYDCGDGIDVDGCLGNETFGKISDYYNVDEFSTLTAKDKSTIVGFTVKFEGGRRKNPYASLNLDAEYRGLFDQPRRKGGKKVPVEDRTKRHRASKFNPSGGFHIGLSYGAWQAAQEPGSLGILLRYMQKADASLFREVFGEHSDELVRVTNSKGRRKGRTSPRTRPVGGANLWQAPWTDRFKKAAEYEVFRDAQRKWVADKYLDKVLPMADDYNLDSKGAIAVLFDIAIQFGVGGMKKRVRKALKPGIPFSESSIMKVINVLPKQHRARRLHILEAAGQETRYVW
jgi:hypothetical protein